MKQPYSFCCPAVIYKLVVGSGESIYTGHIPSSGGLKLIKEIGLCPLEGVLSSDHHSVHLSIHSPIIYVGLQISKKHYILLRGDTKMIKAWSLGILKDTSS